MLLIFQKLYHLISILALYVPIMKILMLLPENELNHHVSTLIVKVASQLKSRKLEERQLARGILSEMAVILGK